ncbi:FtsW/RodA/SpoVE family cell cycle protein, partial [Klebsiella pneumoniae]|nr:FtsW/RodA/SpoVE family cell cycle protein [Klebsiella pneumoniae]
PMALVLKEPDLGTALLFVPVWFVMLLVAGARRGDLVCCVLMGLMLSPVLWQHMSREQRSRVTSLLEQAGPGDKPADDGYQLHQAKQMLALG